MKTALALALLSFGLVAPSAALAQPPADGGGSLDTRRARVMSELARQRFEDLGDPILRWDHVPPVRAERERPHKLLVVLVAYPDVAFDRFKGDAEQGKKLAAFYQEQLFDPEYQRPGTLSHFYQAQSLGRYHLQGEVLPPLMLDHERAFYGLPRRPEGGSWRNDADAEGLVEEVLGKLAAAHPKLDWGSFDRWDPHDYDGDGALEEADGYLDHLVIVFAGGGQSSCQSLFKISEHLTPNVGPEALETLSPKARECAERIWPHRFMVQKREGEGPRVEGWTNARGGVPIKPTLWGKDYNAQSEYTDVSTFIHEFGHSLGLPDVYARTSSNSTGGWELMSSTASPLPQNLSAWSRMMLGWLEAQVVVPPGFGGRSVASSYLRALDDPADGDNVPRAALVALPPKVKTVDLAPLPRGAGKLGLYSGQGNEMNRTVELRVDLTGVAAPITLSLDAWWEIEGGWDFAYLETSVDGGRTWQRQVTTDRRFMPAKHGHDGAKTKPGFTGLSGDLDGDGKNEHMAGCKPKEKLKHGEDKAGAAQNPCLLPTWVKPSFDLGALAGKRARIRLRYFTDMAAVMRGMLIDRVKLTGQVAKKAKVVLEESFEGRLDRRVKLDGFATSPGKHTVLVPHYYVFEYRDPYAAAAGGHRYDAALATPRYYFMHNPETGRMGAISVRHRPGVMVWYFDGAYAWSENDPSVNGQGKGYLLALDADPNELALPGMGAWLKGDAARYDTRYELADAKAQGVLQKGWFATQCFVRNQAFRPPNLAELAPGAKCEGDVAPLGKLANEGRPFLYVYELINTLLPGEARDKVTQTGELYDYRERSGKITWRLRDRTLRYLHNADSPFALERFPDQVVTWDLVDGRLKKVATRAAPAVAGFTDATPARWANPKLFFGGVSVPDASFGFELVRPKADAPKAARVKVYFTWDQ